MICNQTVNARHHIGEYRYFLNQAEETRPDFIFNTYSIIDLFSVGIYLHHESCNGELGSIVFHNQLKEDMTNLEVSIDGGVSYRRPFLDNFGNVVLIEVEVGTYEIYIRTTDSDREERYMGVYEILERN